MLERITKYGLYAHYDTTDVPVRDTLEQRLCFEWRTEAVLDVGLTVVIQLHAASRNPPTNECNRGSKRALRERGQVLFEWMAFKTSVCLSSTFSSPILVPFFS